MVFMNGLNSNFTLQLADYRTALFRNFNLSNSVQHVNTNTRGKWTHIPPVFPQNYKWTTKEVSIKKCQKFLQIIFEEFWKLQEPRNIPTNISKSFPCTFFSCKFMSFSVHGMYRDTSMRTIFKLCHCIGINLYVPTFNNNHAILQDREKLKLEETLTLLFNKRNIIFFALFSQLCDDAFVKYINICLKIKEILPFNVPWISQPMDMYMFVFMCASFQFGVMKLYIGT